jgi:3-oxoacyl-[acyl-carrier-protein] synthase I
VKRAPARIASAGAFCAIGGCLAQIDAALRMGHSAMAASPIHDSRFEPIKMALVPEDALPPLAAGIERLPLNARQRRMLRLASPALREASESLRDVQRTAVFLGLPEAHPRRPASLDPHFLRHLQQQSDVQFELGTSRVFARGRAAGLLALDAALTVLHERRAEQVLVGGVDTFLDLPLLAELDAEERLLGERVMDGFVPGEGAAFIALGGAGPGERALLTAAGSALDEGHRYGAAPAKGEALSAAFDTMLDGMRGEPAPVATTFASLNGESFGAKEWGVARIRHAELFRPDADIVHPADCTGDTGAAAGTLLLALAQHMLTQQTKPGPMLIWASSDGADRACAYLQHGR